MDSVPVNPRADVPRGNRRLAMVLVAGLLLLAAGAGFLFVTSSDPTSEPRADASEPAALPQQPLPIAELPRTASPDGAAPAPAMAPDVQPQPAQPPTLEQSRAVMRLRVGRAERALRRLEGAGRPANPGLAEQLKKVGQAVEGARDVRELGELREHLDALDGELH